MAATARTATRIKPLAPSRARTMASRPLMVARTSRLSPPGVAFEIRVDVLVESMLATSMFWHVPFDFPSNHQVCPAYPSLRGLRFVALEAIRRSRSRCKMARKCLNGLRAIPAGWANPSTDLAAGGIDQQRGRQAGQAEGARRVARRIDIDVQRLHLDLLEERLDRRDAAAVDRERNDFEVAAAKLRLKSVQGGHLLAARRAPRRPDVEEDCPATKVRQRRGPAAAPRGF